MSEPTRLGFLAGGGEMGERIRSFDWAKTPLGPREGWSPALKTLLRIMLANRFPHILWWGPHYIQFYNDPYRPIPGAKHPDEALGRPASECWAEIWHVIGPLIDRPFNGGPATWDDDIFLEINRHGFVEECHFTIAYSPVPDETAPGGIGGVLATVHEITGKIVGDRRVLALRDLSVSSAEARTPEDACATAALNLATHSPDIPFALLYLIDSDRKHARLAGTAGVEPGEAASPAVLVLEGQDAEDAVWPLAKVLSSEATLTLPDLAERLRARVPPGPWTDPPHTAVIVPIHSNKAHYLAGFLVAGISARLQLDDSYRDFLNLVSSQIATSIANAREYEEEKKRAEVLAEIDRAKTAFFSNVSHEFRTPLTLILGPIEELLARSHTELPPFAKGQLEVSHRNSLRLLRLVNTLLDFSRIEAGRVQALYEPTELATFTTELAGVFRAATERAGLSLIVDCSPLTEPVYVDRDMWEKIVLNLISNAFKFTFEGEIAITLRGIDSVAELRVSDTGVGIPAEAMPRLFERFHRVPNMRSRTHEGSGIGLALVQELVKLHGGSVHAESRLGEGATFIVSVPLGKNHLPNEHLGGSRTLSSSTIGAAPFVEEALRWLPEEPKLEEFEGLPREELLPVPCPTSETDKLLPLVLVADDNADMRQYLLRLLSERYRVQTVPDGQAALLAVREQVPDLVLSDVMMPRLDGLGLARELRADPELATIPIILLSARAGEECRVEGLQHGADDYLIKPFSARELLARVAAHLEMAQMRREAEHALRKSEERLRALVHATSDVVYRMSPDWIEMHQLHGQEFIADTENPSSTWLQKYIHPDDQPHVVATIQGAIRNKSIFELEHRVLRANGSLGWTFSRAIPLLDENGEIVEWFGAASDITERKRMEEELHVALEKAEEGSRLLNSLMENIPIGLGITGGPPDFPLKIASRYGLEMTGRSTVSLIDHSTGYHQEAWDIWLSDGVTRPEPEQMPLFRASRFGETVRDLEMVLRSKDGRKIELLVDAVPVLDGQGSILGAINCWRDITERKSMESALQQKELELKEAQRIANIGSWYWDALTDVITGTNELLRIYGFDPATQTMPDFREQRGLCYPADDWERINTAAQESLQTGIGYELDVRAIRNAELIWVTTRSEVVRDGDGHIVGLCGTIQDITERKIMEDQLQKSKDELESRVQERTAELRISNKALMEHALKLERLNRELEEFAFIASHDLQEPLRKIQTFGSMLMKNHKGCLAEHAPEYLARITGSAKRMSESIQCLLHYSRITSDPRQFESVDLRTLARDVVDGLESAIDQAGGRIEINDLPTVEADSEQIRQLFQKLIENSIKYRKENECPVVKIHGQVSGDTCSIFIEDNGIGFEEDDLDLIFKPFQQLHGRGEYEGTGMGLSICRKIVERHEGSITAKSTPGHGATFIVRLPIKQRERERLSSGETFRSMHYSHGR
jgi:signal transduction histidine kinase/CheY-like chemotaxis protein